MGAVLYAPPQVARIPRLTRAKVEDNPRLGGAAVVRGGGSLGGKRPHVARIPRLTRAMERWFSLFLALLSKLFLALWRR